MANMEAPSTRQPIEYLVRSSDGTSDWDLLVDDIATLVPQDIDCRQIPDQPVLTVQKELWQVTYSAEDPGWQLSFTEHATQIECWSFASAVAEQLERGTGISTRVIQIGGFDGGIFECAGSFALESRNYVVFEGRLVSGKIDQSMRVFLPVNVAGSKRLELESVEFVDRRNPEDSRLGLVCKCKDWDEIQLLLDLDVTGQLFEVSHRSVAGIVDRMEVVAEIVEPHRELVESISALLFRHDPIDINYDSNTDEYDPEAATIVMRLLDVSQLTHNRVLEVVHEEFMRWFSLANAGPIESYEEIAREVASLAQATLGQSVAETPASGDESDG